ncbi:hypothetical protein HRR83_005757 [Exophiala dermatitidis]|uniref:Zn(2)-C6 fungal-type domain-containing protein n=2 Tax=Exophiala dermatitidis TaxID=5970 RepID=H6BV71_EXODN|nr:uncharacterized protein HMPREF1120_03143 [Exophiala dermatitidis NIH/UT8656]KAJ4508665.1 hypothetical protein HRR73_007332 [Exophiala dermatitidis]EHY54985.1 hypothetical protein HMPREF1120_03143 [Exophiala dermatitidis NIH/UT8656]KAJ4510916.1 hypothetical protein HRR75_005610 [Exophiala dermatitidis]KAJ4513313.1 hypothetical protein HRR74_006125 [Exophiala dermatitidis]KAJ4538136.1 hypothetical protein HRR77_007176 [Exophiala dermatitidis]
MGAALRHTACKPCRDRKVRCGGEQPACAKCRRANEECVYLPPQRPTRADLTQTVEALQKRLNETEARIQQLAGKEQANNAVAVPTTRPSPPFYAAPWPTTADFPGPAFLQCPLPPFAPARDGDAAAHANQATYANLSFQQHDPSSPASLNNDFLDSLQANGSPRAATERNGSVFFGRDEDARNDFTNTDVDMTAPLTFVAFGTESHTQQQYDQGQSNGSVPPAANGSSTGSSSSPTLPDGSSTTAEVAAATAAVLANEAPQNVGASMPTVLAEFSSSVFHSQAEIAGMSSAVADYIAWMRKVPTGIAPPNTTLVHANMLEAIESRLREMKDIAQTKPLVAFRNMLSSLQAIGPMGPSVCESLGHLERDFERQSAEVAHFFQTRYNACAALSEQAQNVPRAPREAP